MKTAFSCGLKLLMILISLHIVGCAGVQHGFNSEIDRLRTVILAVSKSSELSPAQRQRMRSLPVLVEFRRSEFPDQDSCYYLYRLGRLGEISSIEADEYFTKPNHAWVFFSVRYHNNNRWVGTCDSEGFEIRDGVVRKIQHVD
jgi:hypothetical protein